MCPQRNEAREAIYSKYASMSRAAGGNADLRRIDEWRMPNTSDRFDLDGFAAYLEDQGAALAELVNDPINTK